MEQATERSAKFAVFFIGSLVLLDVSMVLLEVVFLGKPLYVPENARLLYLMSNLMVLGICVAFGGVVLAWRHRGIRFRRIAMAIGLLHMLFFALVVVMGWQSMGSNSWPVYRMAVYQELWSYLTW
jgi:hypothetical protein